MPEAAAGFRSSSWPSHIRASVHLVTYSGRIGTFFIVGGLCCVHMLMHIINIKDCVFYKEDIYLHFFNILEWVIMYKRLEREGALSPHTLIHLKRLLAELAPGALLSWGVWIWQAGRRLPTRVPASALLLLRTTG